MGNVIEWKMAYTKALPAGEEILHKLSAFGEEFVFNSKYMDFTIDAVGEFEKVRVLCGIEGHQKYHDFNLQQVFLPSGNISLRLTQTPFIISILKALHHKISGTPPTAHTSYSSISAYIRIWILFIELVAFNGRLSIRALPKSLYIDFPETVANGWFKPLSIKSRWNQLTEEQKSVDFIKKCPKGNAYRLDVNLFNQQLGTNLFKGINDIPPEIAEDIVNRERLYSPYKFNNRVCGREGYTKQTLMLILGSINFLHVANMLEQPFDNTLTLADKYAERKGEKVEVPYVDQVAENAKLCMSIIEQGPSLLNILEQTKVIIENPNLKDYEKHDASMAIFSGQSTFTVGNTEYHLCGYRAVVNESNYNIENYPNTLTAGEALKVLLGAYGYMILMFTGFRREEVVGRTVGIRGMDIEIDAVTYTTEINRYVLKGLKKRQLAYVGGLTGTLCQQLNVMQARLNDNHSDDQSIFEVILPGITGEGSAVHFDLKAVNKTQNPLRYIAKQQGLTIPGPRQFRQYFASIYYYQFEHPELLALNKHYGQGSLDVTEGYVTNSLSRNINRSIDQRIPIKMHPTEADMADSEFKKLFEDARDQKLLDIVLRTLSGADGGMGGFNKTCRAMYRKLYDKVEFTTLPESERQQQAKSLAKTLKENGYSVEPFQHSNCMNSPGHPNRSNGNCSNQDTGESEREHANASFCSGCEFQDLSDAHVKNIRSDRDELERQIEEGLFILTALETAQKQAALNELNDALKLAQVD